MGPMDEDPHLDTAWPSLSPPQNADVLPPWTLCSPCLEMDLISVGFNWAPLAAAPGRTQPFPYLIRLPHFPAFGTSLLLPSANFN